MKSILSFLGLALLLVLDGVNSYQIRPVGHESKAQSHSILTTGTRRAFLSTATAAVAASTVTPALAADIKVTPLAHTFITSSGSAKPIRENDATRFFTNARVVYLFEGKGADPGLAAEVVDLTEKRKAGKGPGVTPGSVKVSKSATTPDAVVTAAKNMPAGDVLLVGPIASGGTAADGKTLADTAKALGTFVGGKTGNGVVSVLFDAPREGLKLEEGGYATSELLWYSLPKK